MADANTEIIVGYELFDTTVPTGTLSTSVSQVNAAYNLAATRFVKQWLAFHDRGIKTHLATMAAQVSGSAIDKLARATDEAIDIRRQTKMLDLTGAVILRPVGLLDTTGARNLNDDLFDAANFVTAITFAQDKFSYYNGLSTDVDNDDTKYIITDAVTLNTMRSHKTSDPTVKGEVIDVGNEKKEMRLTTAVGEGKTLQNHTTIYSLVKGNLFATSDALTDSTLNRGDQEQNIWENAVVLNNWAHELPPRPTLVGSSSRSFKRDATMFEAMRLDLVNDNLRDLFASFETHDLAIDFDAAPFPFEERLHTMNNAIINAKLAAFSWWVTRCLFDVSKDKVKNKYENVASREIWSKAHESTDLVEVTDFDHVAFQSSTQLKTGVADTINGYKRETINFFEQNMKTKLNKVAENQVYFSACKDQLRPEAFPYVLPFIDLSIGNHLVWGSTITPFLLSVIAVASALSQSATEYDGQDSIPIKSWYVSNRAKKIGEENQGTDDSVKYTEKKSVAIGSLADIISKNFKGFHFSNRKALNNGVYSVLFMEAAPTHKSIKYKIGDDNVELLVDVNGRNPIDISKVNVEVEPLMKKSILAWMYYYIHGFSFPHLETGRKMTGLIEPYCVLIKGPTYSSLATEMQCGNFYYATAIMIALESEACQLLGHIARDNKKRRRDQSFVVADYFATTRASNFQELNERFKDKENFKHKEFSAALVRLVRAIKSFNDCLNDAGKTTRDRVVMGRIDGERMIAAQEVLYGNWNA